LVLFCKIAIALDYKPSDFLERVLSSKSTVEVSKKDVVDPKIRKLITEALQ
jgi:hypothetical protein